MFNIEQVNVLLESRLEELTEAQVEFLVENRLEFIKKSNKDAIPRDHDPEAIKLTTDKIVDHIATKIDPTSNKSNTQWLVNRYKAGDFKIADAKHVKKVLDSFVESKKHLEHQDIGQYKSINHLKDALAPVQSKVDLDKFRARENKADTGLPIVFNEDGNIGYKIPNKSASIENYGPQGKLAQTTWCTAANSKFNRFSAYVGGKYTLHLDNGHVLQLNHQANELKDVKNHNINLKKDPRFAAHKDIIDKFASVTHELEGKPESRLVKPTPINPALIDDALDKHNVEFDKFESAQRQGKYASKSSLESAKDALVKHIKNANLTDEQFSKLSSVRTMTDRYRETIGDKNFTHHLAASPHANPRHLEQIAETGDNNTLNNLIDNSNNDTTSNHKIVDRIVKDNDSELAEKFANSASNALPEHFTRLEHLSKDVKGKALTNPNSHAPKQYFDDLKDSKEDHLSIASHETIPAHIAEHLANTSTEPNVLKALVRNHAVPFPVAKSAFMKAGGDLGQLIEHPDATKDDISEAIKHHLDSGEDKSDNHRWLQSAKVSKDLVKHIVAHPKGMSLLKEYGPSISDAVHIKPADLETLIHRDDFDAKSKQHVVGVLKSPALTPKVVDTLISKAGMTPDISNHIFETSQPENISANHLHAILDSDKVSLHDKRQVLFHPSAQLSHFNKVKDDIRFHGAISNSKNAPPSMLHSLATSAMDHVRLNVANNPNTEQRTHEILKNDTNPEISKVSTKKAK